MSGSAAAAPEREPSTTAAGGLGPSRVVALGFTVNLLILVTGAISGIVTARSMGPTGKGIATAVQAVPFGLGTILLCSLDQSTVYHVARLGPAVRPQVRRTTALLVGCALPLVVLVVVLGQPRLPGPLGAYLVASAALPFGMAGLVELSMAQGAARMVHWNALRLLPSAGYTAALLVALLLSGQLTPLLVADCLVLSNAVFYLAARSYASRLPVDTQTASAPVSAGALLTYGVRTHVLQLQSLLNQRLDVLLISFFGAAAVLGRYSVAVALAAPLSAAGPAIADWLFPRVSAGVDELAALTRSLLIMVTSLALGAGAWYLLAPLVVRRLFGPSFLPAVPATRLLGAAAVLLACNTVLAAWWKGLGRPLRPAVAEGAALLATLVLLPLAVVRYQELGVAVVSLVAYAVSTLVLLVLTYGGSRGQHAHR